MTDTSQNLKPLDHEEFGPPKPPSLDGLTDGRQAGDCTSYYTGSQWFQIIFELAYLLVFLYWGLYHLLLLGKLVVLGDIQGSYLTFLGNYPENERLLIWLTVSLGGLCGGCANSLKWLYHTVAKKRWHRDRLIWRLVVPILSAVLASFTGLMVQSGIIPLFNTTLLADPATGAAFGFFLGLFSDNLLACLQNFALSVFGTVDKDKKRSD